MNLRTSCLLVLFLLILTSANSLAAVIHIHLQNESIQTLTLSEIQNIVYNDSETELVVNLINGSDFRLTLAQIQKLTFGDFTTVTERELELVKTFTLLRSYPNPFNPTTSIRFDLVNSEMVSLTVHNIMGQEVARVVNESMEAGSHEIFVDMQSFASGVYLYRIEAGNFVDMKKMVLVK